ncbi:MAG: hypothetical protein GXP33_15980 [Spirochaetes bacterium]|nr:hypothetical protein [Spirochaetota bacterium]
MKTNSRRNKTRGVAPAILCLSLFIIPVNLFSEQLISSAGIYGEKILVSAELEPKDYSEVVKTMRDGLRPEIFYQFRLYKKQHGIMALLGDKLVYEDNLVYTGSYDLYEKRFFLKVKDDGEYTFIKSRNFLKYFFKLHNYSLSYSIKGNVSDYYLISRVKYIPVKLVPPLNIVSFFINPDSVVTGWQRVTINRK